VGDGYITWEEDRRLQLLFGTSIGNQYNSLSLSHHAKSIQEGAILQDFPINHA